MTAAQSSYTVEGVAHLRITWMLPRSAYGDSAGEWRILLEFGQQIPGIVPFLTANPVPGARQFAASADGTLRVLQISPSRISTWDMATGGTTELPVADPVEPGLPAGLLVRPFDFAVTPQGDRAFVSILDAPIVLEVDLATGASTVLTPSRPAVIDEEFLSLQGAGVFHVAVGPVPPPSGAASAWMLLGE